MVAPSHFPVSCPGCRASYQVPVSMAGLTVTCEACGEDFTLDSPPPRPPDSPVMVETAEFPFPGLPQPGPAKRLLKNSLLLLMGAGIVVAASTLLKAPPVSQVAPAVTEPAPHASTAAFIPPSVVGPAPPEVAEQPMDSTIPQDPVPPLQPVVSEATPPSVTMPDLPASAVTGPTTPVPPETVAAPPLVPPPPALPPAPEEAGSVSSTLVPPPGLPSDVLPSPNPVLHPEPTSPAVSPVLPQSDPAISRKDSRKTLEQFLKASTMEERLSYSQHPDKIRKEMALYSETHPPAPFTVQEITFLTEGEVPESSRKFHLYNVLLNDREAPIPMAVEETRDGYRVDWSAFVESYSHRLRAFFDAPTESPGRFRVMLRRAHYFGPAVPGQDSVRIAYTVEPPMRDETFHVWVDKESLVYQEKLATGERSGWDAESYVIVELLWRGDDQQGRWVGLHRITSDSWRAD